MHSLSEFGANVPAFLAKLWKLVDDSETNELISWSEEGTSFYIRDQAQFSRKLLPMYYKHNNMASFIRQLNMYGFHKIVSADAGSLRLDKDEMEFAHQCFLRGHPYLLEHIKRKVGKSQLLTSKQIEEGKEGANGGVVVKAEFMNKVLAEVKTMRGRQEAVESHLSTMKKENEALWRELSLLRQKHIKQQTIVNKLIQFLVTLVQPSQRLKRRYPLMLGNVPHPGGKSNGKVHNLDQNDIMARSPGTTIHELDPDSLLPDEEVILPDNDPEPLSNTITLHVPGTELTEVIDSNLELGDMSPGAEVLDSLDPSIIQNPLNNSSTVPLLEVNSEQVVLNEENLETSSPSPELLLAVPPLELSPGIIVPALRTGKAKSTNVPTPQITAQKMQTRSTSQGIGPPKSMATRRKAESAMKGRAVNNKCVSVQYKGLPTQDAKKANVDTQPTVKKELRVLPPRSRKKQNNSKETVFLTQSNSMIDENTADDLLAEVGLTDPLGGPAAGSPNNDSTSVVQHIPLSPLPGPTITDVTSPPTIPLSTSSSVCEQQSPQHSPNGPLSSTYDMTLACTSQAGSLPGNTTAVKSSPFMRCDINGKDELDYHVGTMDTELGQLKDILNNSGIQLDANTLLGLFSGEDLSIGEGDGTNIGSKDLSGNELMYYQPDFMDLEEIWNNDQNRSTPPPSPIDNYLSSGVNTPIVMPASPGFSGSASKRRRI